MNPLSIRALWKGLRGCSLTFSLVFAMAVMGSSFLGLLRAPLRTIGIWGPLVLILPIIATSLLAKHEVKLKVTNEMRRICSYMLIFGSILLAMIMWRYEAWLERKHADSVQLGPRFEEKEEPVIIKRGPRGRH